MVNNKIDFLLEQIKKFIIAISSIRDFEFMFNVYKGIKVFRDPVLD